MRLHIHAIISVDLLSVKETPVASFTKGVNPRLAKRLLKTNGHLTNPELTSLVKETTGEGSQNLLIWEHFMG